MRALIISTAYAILLIGCVSTLSLTVAGAPVSGEVPALSVADIEAAIGGMRSPTTDSVSAAHGDSSHRQQQGLSRLSRGRQAPRHAACRPARPGSLALHMGDCCMIGSNQSMKPTRRLQENLSEFATTPSPGLSLSR